MRTLQCEHCGAPLQQLNIRCQYCNTWNRDPANPQDPPVEAPRAQPPAQPAAAPAPTPAQPEAAPAPAPAPAQPAAAPAPVQPEAVAPAQPAPAASEPAASSAAAEKPRFGLRRREPAAAEEEPAKTPAAKVPAAKVPAAKVAPSKHADDEGPRHGAAAAAISAGKRTDAVRKVVADHDAEDTWARGRSKRAAPPAKPTAEDDADVARIEAVAAAVYYVATADDEDEMDDDEYDALVEALGEMLGDDVDSDEFDDTLAEWDDAIEEDDVKFLRDISRALGDDRTRRHALDMAVTVACADGELSVDEEDAAYDVSEAFGIDEDDAERLIERAVRRA